MHVIDFSEFRDWQAHDVANIINVLPAEKFVNTHIPGAINIPLEHPDFTREVEQVVGAKDIPVVVYCASTACDASKKAAKKLEDAGFTHVMCYEGGYKEWSEKSVRSVA